MGYCVLSVGCFSFDYVLLWLMWSCEVLSPLGGMVTGTTSFKVW